MSGTPRDRPGMDLVSGPDVGGGFLFQLTSEPLGPMRRFTIHVQEGGLDGGEPPVAGPSALGFERASGMCPLGGRVCWHRELELPAEEAMRVRFAYNRLRFVIRPLLEQKAAGRPVPFAAGLAETVRRIAAPLKAAGIPWVIGGSAAPALLGAETAPRDLDLATTGEGVRVMAESLAEFLIEPAARTRWHAGPVRWAARAFVGTFQDGLPVEWAEALPAGTALPAGELEWTEETLAHPLTARVGDEEVPVAPPEYALVKSLVTGRKDRLSVLLRLIERRGPNLPLLDRLLTAAAIPPEARRALPPTLGGPPG